MLANLYIFDIMCEFICAMSAHIFLEVNIISMLIYTHDVTWFVRFSVSNTSYVYKIENLKYRNTKFWKRQATMCTQFIEHRVSPWFV